MVEAYGFDVVTVLEKAIAMCRAKEGESVATMETKAFAGVDSETESTIGASLYGVAIRIQTMPRRLAIERASLTRGVVVVKNAQNSL